jgi:hypothetical protein
MFSAEARTIMTSIAKAFWSFLTYSAAAPLGVWLFIGILVALAIVRRDCRIRSLLSDITKANREIERVNKETDVRVSQAQQKMSEDVKMQISQLKHSIWLNHQTIGMAHRGNIDLANENTTLKNSLQHQYEEIKGTKDTNEWLTAFVLVLARRLWPPKVAIGGYVRRVVAFHVERIDYAEGKPSYRGGEPYCGGCEISLAKDTYGFRYECHTNNCEYNRASYAQDEIASAREQAEGLVEAADRKTMREGLRTVVMENEYFQPEDDK